MAETRKSFFRELVETALIAIVLATVLRTFVIGSFFIDGHSMEPTLQDGDRVFVNKLVQHLGGINRGEIIVFQYPLDESRDFIKRVIALPGETVSIRHGEVFINGLLLPEPYLLGNGDYSNLPQRIVPPGQIFVLGDNRRNSDDSRSFGFVPVDNIKGKAFFRYWPLGSAMLIAAEPSGPHNTAVGPESVAACALPVR